MSVKLRRGRVVARSEMGWLVVVVFDSLINAIDCKPGTHGTPALKARS